MSNAFLLLSLFMSAATGIIGASVGLNALIKSNRDKTSLKHKALPAKVTINTNDTLHSGIVVAVTCGIIALISLASMKMILLPGLRRLGHRTKNLRVGLLAFFTLWMLSAQIPYTIFFATRGPVTRAFVGGKELPKQVVEQKAKQLHAHTRYKDFYYLRLLAICPWATFLFAAIATITLAASRPPSDDLSPSMSEKRMASA